jgi:CRP-like cAMP-binding protein
MLENVFFKSFYFGIISAITLPLGAIAILIWKPKEKVIAFLIAFGAGALLAPLSIDLVAKSIEQKLFYYLAAGSIAGSVMFIILNQIINNQGGFLRKAATAIHHMKRKKIKHLKELIGKLSQVPLFRELPPEEIQYLVSNVTGRFINKGTTIFNQGEPGDSLYIIESGAINIVDTKNGDKLIATLKEHDVVGEMALITDEPRSFKAITAEDTRVWIILKEHFERLLIISPRLAGETKDLINNRISDLKNKNSINHIVAKSWINKAVKNLDEKLTIPTNSEIIEEAEQSDHVSFAIWLGILLDGIPQSLVVGASMIGSTLSISLLAGLIISDFPEALSSSIGMKKQGTPFLRILLMWSSVVLVSGVTSLAGTIMLSGASPVIIAVINGVAAGAMLTMIAETMLPEAYYKGGSITGFSVLLGFLSSIVFKSFE